MGFKGVLQFNQANTEFAMQISLCNIVSQMDKSKNTIWPKYGNDNPDANSKTCGWISFQRREYIYRLVYQSAVIRHDI